MLNGNTNEKCLIDLYSHFRNILKFSNDELNTFKGKCLKSNRLIKIPVRGADCFHLDCYDENSVKEVLESVESLQCVLCGKIISRSNLYRDRFLLAIMRQKSFKPGMFIRISKSSGAWSFVEDEIVNQIEKLKIDNEKSLHEYIGELEKIKSEIFLYPDFYGEKFSLNFLINKKNIETLYKFSNDHNENFYLYYFNFCSDIVYDERTIGEEDKETRLKANYIRNFVNFFPIIQRFYKEDENSIPLLINEIIEYIIFIGNIHHSLSIILIDSDFLKMVNYFKDKYCFDSFLNGILRILKNTEDDFLLVLFAASESKFDSENFLSEIENEYDIKDLNKNFKILIENEFNKNEKENIIRGLINEKKALYMKSKSVVDHNKNISLPPLKQFSQEYRKRIHDSLLFSKVPFKFSEISEIDDYEQFSISVLRDESSQIEESNQNKSSSLSFDVSYTSKINKFIISSKNLLYSNITHLKEQNVYYSIEIDLENLKYFIFEENINFREFKLFSQFKDILLLKNFVITNIKEFNSSFIVKLTKSYDAFVFLLNSLTSNKQKKQNLIIFANNLRLYELKQIITKFNIYTDHEMTKEISSDNEVIFSFQDEYETFYFVILEKENEYDEIFSEKFQKILNKVKTSNQVNITAIRNKTILVKERMFYEIRKTRDEY